MKNIIINKLKHLKTILDPYAIPLYKFRRVPFSFGYNSFKWNLISESINNSNILEGFAKGNTPTSFGVQLDERVFEYPWIFSKLNPKQKDVLDAGSTFNFKSIVDHSFFTNSNLHIYTFYPEKYNFNRDHVHYEYGDLRKMCYADQSFDVVVSHSTIEHIDMDNQIYGYDISKNENTKKKSYEYLNAVIEMLRVVRPGGKILLTFPYGTFKHYGFFQQFDEEMVQKIIILLDKEGTSTIEYGKYHPSGWSFAQKEECDSMLSHNPHTGEDKGKDGAAHCRCVCLIEFVKK